MSTPPLPLAPCRADGKLLKQWVHESPRSPRLKGSALKLLLQSRYFYAAVRHPGINYAYHYGRNYRRWFNKTFIGSALGANNKYYLGLGNNYPCICVNTAGVFALLRAVL